MSNEDKQPQVRAADPIITERLVKKDIAASGGGGIPEAAAFVKRGRPFAEAVQAIPLNQSYLIGRTAEEEPKQKKKKPPAGQKDVDNLFKRQSKK